MDWQLVKQSCLFAPYSSQTGTSVTVVGSNGAITESNDRTTLVLSRYQYNPRCHVPAPHQQQQRCFICNANGDATNTTAFLCDAIRNPDGHANTLGRNPRISKHHPHVLDEKPGPRDQAFLDPLNLERGIHPSPSQTANYVQQQTHSLSPMTTPPSRIAGAFWSAPASMCCSFRRMSALEKCRRTILTDHSGCAHAAQDGREVLRRLRRANVWTPTILLPRWARPRNAHLPRRRRG